MKRAAFCVVFLLSVAGLVEAASYGERTLYWCHHNGHTNATKGLTEVLNIKAGGALGALSYIAGGFDSWKIGSPPSKATLDALDGPTVDAWIADRDKDEEADLDDWDDKVKALALVLRDNDELWRKAFRTLAKDIAAVSNSLSAAGITVDDLKEKTVAEWKAAIKAKL